LTERRSELRKRDRGTGMKEERQSNKQTERMSEHRKRAGYLGRKTVRAKK